MMDSNTGDPCLLTTHLATIQNYDSAKKETYDQSMKFQLSQCSHSYKTMI